MFLAKVLLLRTCLCLSYIFTVQIILKCCDCVASQSDFGFGFCPCFWNAPPSDCILYLTKFLAAWFANCQSLELSSGSGLICDCSVISVFLAKPGYFIWKFSISILNVIQSGIGNTDACCKLQHQCPCPFHVFYLWIPCSKNLVPFLPHFLS